MPTPPATKTTFLTSFSSSGGGQIKDPPTRTWSSLPRILSSGCQSHAAGGLRGDFWMASSRWGFVEFWLRREGEEVIVKPPAFGTEGT